jgi:hypothetical protein
MHRNHLITITLAATALAVAGCGSAKPTSTTSARSIQHPVQAAYKFSACMRAHGVSGFPDPVVHSSGDSQSIGIHITPSLTSSPQFKTAQQACQGIMPGPDNVSPAQQAQQTHTRVEDILSFANCMRAHGVARFPDPTAQGQLPLPTIAADVDLHAPAVQLAARTCVPAAHGLITLAAVNQALTSGS